MNILRFKDLFPVLANDARVIIYCFSYDSELVEIRGGEFGYLIKYDVKLFPYFSSCVLSITNCFDGIKIVLTPAEVD